MHKQGASCRISRGGEGLYFWNSQEKKGKSHFLVLYSGSCQPLSHAIQSKGVPGEEGGRRAEGEAASRS